MSNLWAVLRLSSVSWVGAAIFFAQMLFSVGIERGHAESRCEWTDCSQSGSAPASTALRECQHDDRAACGEECRTEFDQEHFRCIDRCLSKRCQQPVESPLERRAEDTPEWQSDLCLEGQSPTCESECRDGGDANQARCRVTCLSRACPTSRKMGIAEEGAKPGTVACRRCRAREERECRRTCGVGLSVSSGGRYSGLGTYACEKACIAGACGGECAF